MFKFIKALLVVGNVIWGLIGLSFFFAAEGENWNMASMIFGRISYRLEAVFYLLLGAVAIYYAFGKCCCGDPTCDHVCMSDQDDHGEDHETHKKSKK